MVGFLVDLAMHLSGADGGVRVIAYVVSGIGFLGAGVIMKQGMDVRGLNTARGAQPRLNWSNVVRSLARWTGLCSGVTNTTQPRRIRSVQAAA